MIAQHNRKEEICMNLMDTLSGSLLLLVLILVAVVVLGLIVIQKKDILVSNLETGGV